MDVSSEESIESAFKNVREKLGDPEVLVYNAGGFKRGSILQIKAQETVDVFKAHFHTE
jgi:NAD(P)-dependent dehydrogenase (short-subunit alcohol dehydrogenase family)